MKTLLLTTLILFLIISSVLAQNDHPIDKSFKECISKSKCITSEMEKCGEEAYMKWEIELNKYYNLLVDILDKEAKDKLVQSQLAWIKFKNLEFEFIPDYFQDIGSYIGPTIIENKIRIIKARALELKVYYETVKDK